MRNKNLQEEEEWRGHSSRLMDGLPFSYNGGNQVAQPL
jgi:hypothetical protein